MSFKTWSTGTFYFNLIRSYLCINTSVLMAPVVLYDFYPAIKCECTFLNLYSVAQGRRTVIRNSTLDRKLPAILYAPMFVSPVTIFMVCIDFFLSWWNHPTPICRRKFCRWILAKEVNFEQKTIFSDKKMFQLHPAPHCQNDHIRGPFYTDEEVIWKVQGEKKVMC